MDPVQAMAAEAALKKMIREGYISICTIDHILHMAGIIPPHYDYEILHTLHCVKFMDMAPELLRGLPVLLQRVMNGIQLDCCLTQYNQLMISVKA